MNNLEHKIEENILKMYEMVSDIDRALKAHKDKPLRLKIIAVENYLNTLITTQEIMEYSKEELEEE